MTGLHGKGLCHIRTAACEVRGIMVVDATLMVVTIGLNDKNAIASQRH